MTRSNSRFNKSSARKEPSVRNSGGYRLAQLVEEYKKVQTMLDIVESTYNEAMRMVPRSSRCELECLHAADRHWDRMYDIASEISCISGQTSAERLAKARVLLSLTNEDADDVANKLAMSLCKDLLAKKLKSEKE